jgi:hypothetical protein
MFKVDLFSKQADKIRSARSFQELNSLISGMIENVDELSEQTDKFLQSLSKNKPKTVVYTIALSNSNRIELGDLPAPKQKKTKETGDIIPASSIKFPSVTPDFTSFKAPDLTEITRENMVLHKLEQQITELQVAEQVLLSNTLFSKMENNKALRLELRQAINKGKVAIADQLKAMAKIARESRPKHLAAMIDSTVKFLNEIILKQQFTQIVPRTFVYKSDPSYSGKDNQINYQTFIHIKDFVSDSEVLDSYSIVLTCSIDMDDGVISYHVTSLTSDKIPGSFPVGKPLKTSNELRNMVMGLVKRDTRNVTGDRVAFGLNTKQMRRTTEFLQLEFVDDMRQQDDYLLFRLVKGLSEDEQHEAVLQIGAAVDKVFYNKLTDVRKQMSVRQGSRVTEEEKKQAKRKVNIRPGIELKVGRNSRRLFVRVALLPKTKLEITRDKLRKLGTELNISQNALNNIMRHIQ